MYMQESMQFFVQILRHYYSILTKIGQTNFTETPQYEMSLK